MEPFDFPLTQSPGNSVNQIAKYLSTRMQVYRLHASLEIVIMFMR